MNYNKLLILIDKLKSIAIIGHPNGNMQDLIMFGNLIFQGRNNVSEFYNTFDEINNLIDSNNEISQTFSKETIKNKIIEMLRNSIVRNIPLTLDQVKDFVTSSLSEKLIDFEIFRVLNGVELKGDDIQKLGPFCIYQWGKHKNQIKLNFKIENNKFGTLVNFNDEDILVSVKTNVRDPKKALELADNKFSQFENIISYMLGKRDSCYHVSIFNYGNSSLLKHLIISQEKKSIGVKRQGAFINIEISDPQITDANYVWSLLENDNLNEIQARLLKAIEWVGKARNDLDDTNAFVQYVFAIESLLSFSDKGIITPSIANQMSEYSAFIIGGNYKERVKIVKLIKNLYSCRSAIVHGRQKTPIDVDLLDAAKIAIKLIVKFTTDDILKKITTMEELTKTINKKKFS